MAIYEIPTFSDSSAYVETINIDGIFYHFHFIWNTRDESWNLSISLVDGTSIIMGRKLVTNYEMLQNAIVENQPIGFLILIDQNGGNDSATRNSLGTEHRLYYLDNDEELRDAIIQTYL